LYHVKLQNVQVKSVASVGAWGYASVKIQSVYLQRKHVTTIPHYYVPIDRTCVDIGLKLVKEAQLSDR
jgi:hypothetical protein